jgi:hypothetical protein
LNAVIELGESDGGIETPMGRPYRGGVTGTRIS